MLSRRRHVWAYLLLTFGLAWGTIALSLIFNLSMMNLLVQLPVAFAPAIAALVVRFATREGFGDAGLAPRFRSAGRFYLLAGVVPALALVAVVGIAAAGSGYALDTSVAVSVLPLLVMMLVLAPVFWGEEFGWRSYLQQRLSRRPIVAIVGTGLIWGVWHWPLIFTDYATYDRPVLGLALWTLHSVLLGVVLAWLFVRSGTVWVACLAHAGSNLLLGVGGEELLVDGAGFSREVVSLLGLAPVAVLAVLLLVTGGLRHRIGRQGSDPGDVPDPPNRVEVSGHGSAPRG